MQTVIRQFFIPETEEDYETLSKQNHLTKYSSQVNGRTYTYFTDSDSDKMLIYDLARALQSKYTYEALYVRHSTTKNVFEELDIHKYDIVIDIRKENNAEGLNGSELKSLLHEFNLTYKWMPQLSQKENVKHGYNSVKGLAKQYRRFLFIGNNKSRLDKVCVHLAKITKIHLLGIPE